MLSWQPLLFFFSFPYLLDSMAFKVARGGSPEDIGSSMLGSYPTAQVTVEDSAGECEKYCKPPSRGRPQGSTPSSPPLSPLLRYGATH